VVEAAGAKIFKPAPISFQKGACAMSKEEISVRLSDSELVQKIVAAIESLDADDLCVVAETAIGGKIWHAPEDDDKEYTWEPEPQEQPDIQAEERLAMSEKKILTRDQVAAYVASGGTKCPFCGSENISGESVQTDAGYAWQSVTCDACDTSWDDIYTLTGVEPGKYGEWIPEPGAPLGIHLEVADDATLNELVDLLKRCSYALDIIPNTKLPDGTRTYGIAEQLNKILPRERKIEPPNANR
jgi:transcription elongation factor Elf1